MSTSNPRRNAALLVACGGSFLAFLDVTIANLALPAVGHDFDVADIADLSWIVTLYTVVFAALLAPAGRIADVVGRRRLFVIGMAVFVVGSLAAAAAPGLGMLLAARATQGLGGALLLPASLALVLSSVAAERRPAAIGLWSASASAAAALGPAMGGVLVDGLGWRWLFCINVPIGGWLLISAWRLPKDAGSAKRWPDPLGITAFGGGVFALVFGVAQSSQWDWADLRTVACLVVGVFACAFAAMRSAGHPSPAIAVGLWRNPTYVAANAVSLLFGAALFTWLLVGVLYLTSVWGYSELRAGLVMTPGALVAMLVGVGVSRVARGVAPRVLVATGGLLMAASGLVIDLVLPSTPHFWQLWLPVGVVVGAGMGAISVGVSSAAALSAPAMEFAAATGLNVAIRQVGGAIGVAAMAAMLTHYDSGSTAGYGHVYLLCSALALALAAVGWLLVMAPADRPSQPSDANLTQVPRGAAAAVPSTTTR
jgi:EmrB/QacA subfamily drug resistance transporter